MSNDVIEHLRSREVAAYTTWRNTAWSDEHVHQRHAAWLSALRALTEEMEARVRLARAAKSTPQPLENR